MHMKSLALTFRGLVIAAIVGGGAGYLYGRHEGSQLERARIDAQSVRELTDLIESHKGLIAESAAAGKGMRQALVSRRAQDQAATKELRNVLAETADRRVDCVFEPRVMRELEAARERAAQAAAGGVLGAVPATGGQPGEPR